MFILENAIHHTSYVWEYNCISNNQLLKAYIIHNLFNIRVQILVHYTQTDNSIV